MNMPERFREEFLASFCFASEGETEQEISRLSAFAEVLDGRFRYWEIVYVLSERHRERASRLAPVLLQSRNLRIIVVKDDTNFYWRRAIAVSEAIGDVTVLTSFKEVDFVDAPSFADEAYATGEIVLGRSEARLHLVPLFHSLLALISPYRINDRDLQTIAMPRTRLNALLSRSTFALDLRFEPKLGGGYARRAVRVGRSKVRRSAVSDRYELLEELISTSAPRILRAYAALSAFVAGLAGLYALYAVAILLFKPVVQEGWFSTAIVQSGSVGFIALGMTVIGIGVADIAERLTGRSRYRIVEEIANIDFFEDAKDMNVVLAAGVRAGPELTERDALH